MSVRSYDLISSFKYVMFLILNLFISIKVKILRNFRKFVLNCMLGALCGLIVRFFVEVFCCRIINLRLDYEFSYA